MTLTRYAHKMGLLLKKKLPVILSILGGVGVIGTSYLAVRATPRAIERIKEESRINHDGDPNSATKLEMFKASWKLYLPATITGLSTIGCILGSNLLSNKKQVGIASAYGLLDQYIKRYKSAAKTLYGDDADKKIDAQVAREGYVSADGIFVYERDLDPDAEDILFYDLYSQRYFRATMAAVLNAQYHLNRNLSLRGDATVNEFYDFLGIDHIEGGDEIGWDMGELLDSEIMWLDFENSKATLEDGMECCIISAIWSPYQLNYEGGLD